MHYCVVNNQCAVFLVKLFLIKGCVVTMLLFLKDRTDKQTSAIKFLTVPFERRKFLEHCLRYLGRVDSSIIQVSYFRHFQLSS